MSNSVQGAQPSSVHPPSWMVPRGRSRPRYISTQRLVSDSLRMVPLVPPETAVIIGIARSGMLPASVLATALHLPLYALDQKLRTVRETGCGARLENSLRGRNGPGIGPVLVVDDMATTGRSVRMARETFDRRCRIFPSSHVFFATIYCNPTSKVKPDLWVEEVGLPRLLEWNLFNSAVSSVASFDLDGVICHDAGSGGKPGTPFHLPRHLPAHIITGRPERDRAATMRWLKQWNVRTSKLVMGPWSQVPGWRQIAQFKAAAVAKYALEVRRQQKPYGPALYIESCPQQAKRIAELSGVMTVCLKTGEVLGPDGCWL